MKTQLAAVGVAVLLALFGDWTTSEDNPGAVRPGAQERRAERPVPTPAPAGESESAEQGDPVGALSARGLAPLGVAAAVLVDDFTPLPGRVPVWESEVPLADVPDEVWLVPAPVETLPDETLPDETLPDETPVETLPVETLPVETLPVETLPGDVLPVPEAILCPAPDPDPTDEPSAPVEPAPAADEALPPGCLSAVPVGARVGAL